LLSEQSVTSLAEVGRTRWKVENETINVLKNQGYHRSAETFDELSRVAHVEASNITLDMANFT
jgi:hypothetical protein